MMRYLLPRSLLPRRVLGFIADKGYLKILLVFTFFFFCFSLIYFSVDRFPSTDDPFFHIRFAELVRERGLNAFTDFNWLYHSKIAQEGIYLVYYNFLFYLVLIPFTFIKPLFLGIKLYGVAAASLAFTLFYFFLLKLKEKHSLFWTLAILAFIGQSSIWRFLMTRPFTLAPALLLVLLYFLWKKNYLGVFLLSFAYLFWHSATFFFPLVVAAVYFIFVAFYTRRYEWKPVLISLAGTTAALLVVSLLAPGFLLYMEEIVFRIFSDTIIGQRVPIAEGNELYAASFFDFLRWNAIFLILFIIAAAVEVFRYLEFRRGALPLSEKDSLRGTLFFLTLIFLLGTFFSRRNADFFIFFAAPYMVLALNDVLDLIKIEMAGIKKALAAGLLVAIAYLFGGNLLSVHQMIAAAGSYNLIEPAAEWLKKNTKPGEVIFHPTWNWFTLLFYYNPNNYYIAGLEPRFLYTYNPTLYWQWSHIANDGYVCGQEKCEVKAAEQRFNLKKPERQKVWYEKEGVVVANTIWASFQSKYILTSRPYVMLNRLLDSNARFKKVFDDNSYFMIYEILPK